MHFLQFGKPRATIFAADSWLTCPGLTKAWLMVRNVAGLRGINWQGRSTVTPLVDCQQETDFVVPQESPDSN